MFSEIFIKQLVKDIKENESTITIIASDCIEPVYDIIVEKKQNKYKFSGIPKDQITMLQYLLEI